MSTRAFTALQEHAREQASNGFVLHSHCGGCWYCSPLDCDGRLLMAGDKVQATPALDDTGRIEQVLSAGGVILCGSSRSHMRNCIVTSAGSTSAAFLWRLVERMP